MNFGVDTRFRKAQSRWRPSRIAFGRFVCLPAPLRPTDDSNLHGIIRSAAKRSTGDADAISKGAIDEGYVEKIFERDALIRRIRELKQAGKRIVFTNGCFDILHPGHIHFLEKARRLGDMLVVGVNSDRSVRELKGSQRPILTQLERCRLLAGLESVSFVTVFDESTPLGLIQAILPHVLVKGGDWGLTEIVGREDVEADGGTVTSLPYENGQSTSSIIERILNRYRP